MKNMMLFTLMIGGSLVFTPLMKAQEVKGETTFIQKLGIFADQAKAKLKKQADAFIAAVNNLKNTITQSKKEGTLTPEKRAQLAKIIAGLLAALGVMAAIIVYTHGKETADKATKDLKDSSAALSKYPPELLAKYSKEELDELSPNEIELLMPGYKEWLDKFQERAKELFKVD